jgi:hypothetical protein
VGITEEKKTINSLFENAMPIFQFCDVAENDDHP